MSGHSRWAQVKHKKAVTDAKKGQLFSKLVREIMVAIREGGERPDANIRLRMALGRAREAGLPKDNIERAITRAKGGRDTELFEEFLYEAMTPEGVMVLIEGITDNKNRALASLKQILSHHGARLADPGSVAWNFEKIGTIEITREENRTMSAEDIELAIADAGAEDFLSTPDGWHVETKFQKLEEVRRALESSGIHVKGAAPDYKARMPLTLSSTRRDEVDALLDELVAQEDVQEVYSNIAQPNRT